MIIKSHNTLKSNINVIILLTIIGFFSIKIFAYKGIEGCFGVADGLAKAPVWLIGIILLMISIIRLFRSKDSNRNRKLITFGLLILTPVAIITQIVFDIKINNSEVILATTPHPEGTSQGLNLILRKNKTYTISYSYVEWACYHSGEYSLENDTLILLDQLDEHFSNITSQTYILTESSLIPLEAEKDTLIIEKTDLPSTNH